MDGETAAMTAALPAPIPFVISAKATRKRGMTSEGTRER